MTSPDTNTRRINILREIARLSSMIVAAKAEVGRLKPALIDLRMQLATLNMEAHEEKLRQKEEHNANYDRQTALYGRAPGRRWK